MSKNIEKEVEEIKKQIDEFQKGAEELDELTTKELEKLKKEPCKEK